MPQPTRSQVHIDAVLTNVSVAYMQDQGHFIANRVFPVVPVEKQSDKYFIYDKDSWMQDDAQLRAPGTESAGSGYTVSNAAYFCDVFALHKDVDNQTAANSDAPLDPYLDATEYITSRLLLKRETKFVSDYISTGVWGTDVIGGTNFTAWSDYANSDPIGDIETAKATILQNTGKMPNKLVLGYDVFRILRHHPDVVDRFNGKSGTSATPAQQQIAEVLGVEDVVVSMSVKASSAEGSTAASYGFTFGKHALLCFAAPRPSIRTPSAGYIFQWTGVSEGLGTPAAVSRIDMPHLKSVRIEGEIAFDNKVVAADLGYYFKSATT